MSEAQALMTALHQELLRAQSSLSEYELLQALRRAGSPLIPPRPVTDNYELFRLHFRVFNALYRLRDQLRAEQRAELVISALRIELRPYLRARAGLVVADPLRAYYLDVTQLETTTPEDVANLLNHFWALVNGESELLEALRLLGLDRSADYGQIRRRYRQLASRHHPDHGGSTGRLQAINAAMDTLRRHYGHQPTADARFSPKSACAR
ncbi:DNA-J related domain-containing protein [Pseudomonas oryzihabitans]|uniref:Molecular chaperone DnaJ n=1 Tax=Pseudomonas oryzihabitans TaxID=47885 RepID=A0ABX3IT66_9PSED|nr:MULTISPECIES: DNA-J related domain-containing protein [Pseudomonas]MCI1008807.1 DnaJ domain-containing protein [Pseudomonas oryzihabitans]MDU4056918.1 DNA-J related domain-containing protein [Pseudomonas oryzihabitans]ONN70860.1 molecular chaperone DnaJ [Pseudomonas psychrotolerans]